MGKRFTGAAAPRKGRSRAGVPAALAALGLLASGCGGGSASGGQSLSAEASTGTASAGGEAPEAGGGGAAPAPDGPAQSPAPGEVASGAGEGSAGTPPGTAAAPSPWGSTLDQTGTPLPPRAPVQNSARSQFDSGMARSRSGDNAGARKAFEKALSNDPQNYLILYNLGVVEDHDGKEDKALDYYKRSLAVQPDFEGAAAGVVAIYLRRGQAANAESFLRPLAERWERNLYLQAQYADLLTYMNRTREASDAARKALRRDEKFVPAMISLAKANLREGKTELAESILAQALEVDAKNAELHYLNGQRLVEEGKLAPALSEYRKAVELRPDYPEARMALGIRLLAGANYDEALTQFKAVANLAPKLVEVHLALGDAYRATSEWKLAKQSFDRALQMKSDLPQAHFNLGLMYLTAGADYPEMDLLQALDAAKREFQTYRQMMGGKLPRDDLSGAYLEDIDKRTEREKKRLEREERNKQREAERAAREEAAGAEGGDAEGAEGGDAEESAE